MAENLTPQNPQEYYDKYGKREGEQDLESSEVLAQNFFYDPQKMQEQESGSIDLSIGHYDYHLEFDQLPDDEEIESNLDHLLLFTGLERMVIDPSRWDHFRIAKRLLLTDSQQKISLDLEKILPPNTIVVFDNYHNTDSKDPEHNKASHIFDKETRKSVIFLHSDIGSPRAILNLLHEIGHFNQLSSESSRESLEPTVQERAKEIQDERNAWAWALKRLHPFLDREAEQVSENSLFPQNLVMNFIKKNCLWTYQD